MKLLILVLQVALVGSLTVSSGFLGDNITLASGAPPSWNLTSIEWSIFSNNTWIATYRGKRKNTERVDRYKGRLSLNIISGDLTIRNLTPEDAMEYTVDLINTQRENKGGKTKLIVKQRLPKPTIETFPCESVKGGGFQLFLLCSSTDKSVDLSWSKTTNATVFNSLNADVASTAVKVFLSTKQNHVKFTCTSSKNSETASSDVTPSCDDNEPEPTPQHHSTHRKNYIAITFFVGLLVGVLVMTVLYFQKGKLCPSPK
ncbi:uncharacterized protein si:cabz01074946.1 isoform X2 [Centropristis striata]|uniref:uncharacterized protein si:cabz01074946.1 isoform X2 n=1 Tax=Centropristis striata TaxID=184440 RepID=UPI0027DFF70A|nr:uncharacterized protein si:cabz01074946.1 isoform X2 [Centropristis striata]